MNEGDACPNCYCGRLVMSGSSRSGGRLVGLYYKCDNCAEEVFDTGREDEEEAE